jgi:fibronectin-binding autotransporter adhesin
MRRVARLRCFGACAAAIGVGSPAARAFDRFWNSFSSGNFSDSTRWIGGAVPGTSDAAIFSVFGGTPAPYTVTFVGRPIILGPANYMNDQLRIGPNTVRFVQSDSPALGPSSYTLNTNILIGEGTGASFLTTTLSVLASPNASIGAVAGSPSTLNVNGGAFNVTGSGASYDLAVGDVGTGTLSINNSAQVNLTGAEGNAVIGNNAGVSGTVNVNGPGVVWNNNSNSLVAPFTIGGFGNGTLNISAGGQVNDFRGEIASDPGSSGSVTVDGAGSTWNNRDFLTVGFSGAATLTISNGGQVNCSAAIAGSSPGSIGTVNVSGAGSQWAQSGNLNIGGNSSVGGSAGAGIVRISGGASVGTGGDAFVGTRGSGSASVSGVGSNWTVNGQLRVDSNGELDVTAGGVVAGNTALNSGVINVGGTGSAFNVSDFLIVSNGAIFATSTGTINITAGGQVNNRVAFVAGSGLGGLGGVNIDGAGSAWNTTDQLYVALEGQGTFHVSGGAHVNAAQTEIGVSASSIGAVRVDGIGSTWTSTDGLAVGVAGVGDFMVTNGGKATVLNGSLSIGLHGTLQGNSTVIANVRNGGTIAPGISPSFSLFDRYGTLKIMGDYVQTPAGQFPIDLNSTSLFDRLMISGDANLAGDIRIQPAIGFVPLPGDKFTVLTSAQCNGTFNRFVSLGGSAIFYVPIYTPTDVILFIAAGGEKTWAIDASGNSSLTDNWFGGVPGAIDDKVAFSTIITAGRTVSVDAPFTAGSIYFDGDKNYTVQGPGGITLDVSTGNASLAVKNVHGVGQHTISAPLTLNDNTTIDVAPGGTLRITQPMTVAPGVAITKTGTGLLAAKNVRADGLAVNGGTVQMIAGGGAAGTSLVKSLTIDPAARLDLNDNDLLINYSGATPYPTIRTLLLNGLNTGTGGIVSTSGLAAGNTVHAIVDNTHLHLTTFDDLAIDDTTIIAKYTLRGDANLDGKVNFADLVTLAQNFNNNTGLASWDIGDLDYDGNVGFADLVLLAQNFNGVLPGEPIAGAPESFEDGWAAALASVPDPAGAGAFALAAGGLCRRRRRERVGKRGWRIVDGGWGRRET